MSDGAAMNEGGTGMVPWRQATEAALYGPNGFFVRPDTDRPGLPDRPEQPDGLAGPAAHFRTSVHASPLFARAVLRLVEWVDEDLGRPDRLVVCDVGAGRGELLVALAQLTDGTELGARLELRAVERAPRPDGLPDAIAWGAEIEPLPHGLLFANEWLDNVPVDVAEVDDDGTARYLLVDPATGEEQPGPALTPEDAAWLAAQYPALPRGGRAELGLPRDRAWSAAVAALGRGLAVTADYAHTRDSRPPFGTLTGYRDGRQVAPVPDGSCDLTAHVALDACLDAAVRANPRVTHSLWTTQREALRSLGVSGARPPLTLASSNPAGYLRALSAAGEAAELIAVGGLGSFLWGAQAVDMEIPAGWQTLCT
ncbi:SAM-dependent methyltransferase [Streptacidiphilus fuscans]|uniref:SAM-dependent methyltransferase n=1 Tax=Streptacidiphilus fuscans TaxID=2789292 RepID=A0A931BHH5_9ACTN|nr:SAM-dependent methyltransferase [Streptacidiphilus fuscans]MBF9073545.1 SAM-dependent methyltransferase [Streptacidiphilus fuscans]